MGSTYNPTPSASTPTSPPAAVQFVTPNQNMQGAQNAKLGYQASATPQEVAAEKPVEVCGTWSDPLRCPLVIFAVLAVIFFFFSIWSMWSNSRAGATGNFWLVSIITLIIYLIITLAFGYWIKKKCSECSYGTSWMLFFVALFLPIILGLVASVVIGAVGGGLAFLSSSLNKRGGSSGSKGPGAPGTTPTTPAPTPGGVPVVTPGTTTQGGTTAAPTAQAASSNNPLAGLSPLGGLTNAAA